MKIDYVIVSTDGNSLYENFWDVLKPIWYEVIGIKPILVEISNENKIIEHPNYIVHKIKKIDNLNTGFQSQVVRMFVTQFYGSEVCLTSDIDMIPISKNYFTSNILQYNQDDLVIFSSDAYKTNNRYPICYNAASGNLFKEILDLNDSFEEYCSKLMGYNWGWDTDELFFGLKVNSYYNQKKVVKLNRGWTNGMANLRIDRVNWTYNNTDLTQKKYIDCHSLRPYGKYKTEINKIVENILQ